MKGTRTYRIRSHGDEFFAASLANGHQVLMVPTEASRLAQLNFDSMGSLLSSKEIESVDGRLRDLGNSLGAQSEAIEVREFSVPGYGIRIRAQPESFDEFLACPESVEPDAKFRERTCRQIQDWEHQGRFVLVTWGKDYWMNADGSVFAT